MAAPGPLKGLTEVPPWRRRRCPRCNFKNPRAGRRPGHSSLIRCECCGTVYEARTHHIVGSGGWGGLGGFGGDDAGVREPRHPLPLSGAGAAALPLPESDDWIA